MKSTPPMARLSTSLVFGAVWPMYWPTRSSRVTATRCPLRTYPKRNRICAMRSATVVLPVPGLPVKDMCRLGACACSPRFMRSLSITRSAAMSRMRALMGASPMRSCSSSVMTASAWLCASTSLTVRAPAAAAGCEVAGGAACAAGGGLPGIEYRGEAMASGHLAHGRHAAQLVAHGIDHRLVIGAAEDGTAGDESVGAGGRDTLDILHLDAAVDLQADVAPAGLDEGPGALDLAQRGLDETLSAEARVDAHDEHQVDLVNHVLERLEGAGRVEGEARLAARRPDQLQRTVDVERGLRVEADEVGAGGGEALDQGVHRGHHQVHVKEGVTTLRTAQIGLERLRYGRSDGEVRDVVVVHDVEVHPVSARGDDALHFLAEARKVRRQNRRGDLVHGGVPLLSLPVADSGLAVAALAFRAVRGVAADGVAHAASAGFLALEHEAGLLLGAVDDEAHGDALDAAGGIEGHEADVVVRKGVATVLQLHQYAGGVLQVEHRHAEHLPVGVARVRVIGVLDAPGVALLQSVLDLQRDLRIAELRQEAELPLRDACRRVGHHVGRYSLAFSAPLPRWAGSRNYRSGCS